MQINKTPEQIMEDIQKVKEMRAFQKSFFFKSRTGKWTNSKEKQDAIDHAKALEADVDARVESYYPKSVQGTML